VVDVVRAPIETKVIEEIKKPPPPPEIVCRRRRSSRRPASLYSSAGSPDRRASAAAADDLGRAVAYASSADGEDADSPSGRRADAGSAAAAAGLTLDRRCLPDPGATRHAAEGARENITGVVRAQATIKAGKVIAVEILSSPARGVFDAAVRNAMLQYGCSGAGDEEVKAIQEFVFKLE
jgi:protein TonB